MKFFRNAWSYVKQHFRSLPNDTHCFNKSEFSWRAAFTAVDSSFNENKLKESNLVFKHSTIVSRNLTSAMFTSVV